MDSWMLNTNKDLSMLCPKITLTAHRYSVNLYGLLKNIDTVCSKDRRVSAIRVVFCTAPIF